MPVFWERMECQPIPKSRRLNVKTTRQNHRDWAAFYVALAIQDVLICYQSFWSLFGLHVNPREAHQSKTQNFLSWTQESENSTSPIDKLKLRPRNQRQRLSMNFNFKINTRGFGSFSEREVHEEEKKC